MNDLRENKLLWRSLQACYGVLLICALEIFPPLNDLLQLTPLSAVGVATHDVFTQEETTENIDGMISCTLVSHAFAGLVQAIGFPVFVCGLMAADTFLVFMMENMIRKTLGG